jgi:hypothetical protein
MGNTATTATAVTAAETAKPVSGTPERRCIATGVSVPTDALLRFVVGPAGNICTDLGRELPGRGIWVRGRRELLERAVKKRLFPRAAKQAVAVADDLPDQVEALMAQRALALLGLAKRAGQLTLGYEKVRALLATDTAVIAISAHDASLKGRDKLLGGNTVSFADAAPGNAFDGRIVVDLFGVEELSLALGRENVVHAALRVGGLADRFLAECRRLKDYRG